MSRKAALASYYRSINRPGQALAYSWPALAKQGFDDPREVCILNNQLVADGVLHRQDHGPSSYGDSSLYLQAEGMVS